MSHTPVKLDYAVPEAMYALAAAFGFAPRRDNSVAEHHTLIVCYSSFRKAKGRGCATQRKHNSIELVDTAKCDFGLPALSMNGSAR